ncbi:MAG: hypothetical protein HY926_02390 [Elusimicrobia bacterium]|nr:hypothetical protein [Elusimicrobiota bacterium]
MWERLERRFQRWAVPDLTRLLVAGQVLLYIAGQMGAPIHERGAFIPELALAGQWWRFLSFIFIPPLANPLFAFFAWYLFYLMGSALEGRWGALRYDLFLLAGYALTVAAALLVPGLPATNVFIGGSVFLAFAFLYPDFELLILFILPVKVKWLALLTWLSYGFQLLFGGWQTRLLVLASVGNFLLFFGRDILRLMKSGHRRMADMAREASGVQEPFHRCAVCGVTDVSHPTMDFRYCPECGGLGYCRDHIAGHRHVKKKD